VSHVGFAVILVALGGNVPHPRWGDPRRTLEEALRQLPAKGIDLMARSHWYTSPPDPPSAQGWYTNGVAAVQTKLPPRGLLAALLAVEAGLGRTRDGEARNAARTIDLDLIDYDGLVLKPHRAGDLELPHPRLHLRSFVLLPLAELAPQWKHPVTHQSIADLIAGLPTTGRAEPLPRSA
jgi:2-amino-4-hydroxy-6-hydroxymethyldihydropteridine diphosphokinase